MGQFFDRPIATGFLLGYFGWFGAGSSVLESGLLSFSVSYVCTIMFR